MKQSGDGLRRMQGLIRALLLNHSVAACNLIWPAARSSTRLHNQQATNEEKEERKKEEERWVNKARVTEPAPLCAVSSWETSSSTSKCETRDGGDDKDGRWGKRRLQTVNSHSNWRNEGWERTWCWPDTQREGAREREREGGPSC